MKRITKSVDGVSKARPPLLISELMFKNKFKSTAILSLISLLSIN